jgi:hypothetical protein
LLALLSLRLAVLGNLARGHLAVAQRLLLSTGALRTIERFLEATGQLSALHRKRM